MDSLIETVCLIWQLLKAFELEFYKNQIFNTLFTRDCHWTISIATWIQYTPSTSLRLILLLPSSLLLYCPTKMFYAFLVSPMQPVSLTHIILLIVQKTWNIMLYKIVLIPCVLTCFYLLCITECSSAVQTEWGKTLLSRDIFSEPPVTTCLQVISLGSCLLASDVLGKETTILKKNPALQNSSFDSAYLHSLEQ